MYVAAWVVAAGLAVMALFTLGRPDTPRLSPNPATFDGLRAAADLRTLAQEFPQRVAGSDADNRAGLWVLQELKKAGLETHIDGVAATVGEHRVALQNVWGISRGDVPGAILVIANRDVPPGATQGANDNASGVAALLELARTFTVTAHRHSVIFVCTSGDAYGALGAREFAAAHDLDGIAAVIALRKIAAQGDDGIALDGWSLSPKAAPPWLWLLSAPAARVGANSEALLPGIATQVLRLAVPTSAGSQAPFVAAGVPGLSLSWDGPRVPPEADTVDAVSTENLTRVGTTASTMLLAVDGAGRNDARSGGAVFLTRQATLPGSTLVFILAVLLLPLAAVTLDLYAHSRRARLRLLPAWKRAGLHLAPWLVLILIVYFANLVGLLPQSDGAAVPPDSRVVAHPQYLRVMLLVVLLVAAYLYATAVERRLERRVPTDPRATIVVAHLSLLAIALLILLVAPYSVLLILPAGVLWPLARPGKWRRSILPAYAGLGMVVVALVYYAAKLDLGWKVWWYFFLLLEDRAIPAGVVLLGALFVSTAGMLAHTLHGSGSAALETGLSRNLREQPGEADGDADAEQADGLLRAEGETEPRRPRRAGRRAAGSRLRAGRSPAGRRRDTREQ